MISVGNFYYIKDEKGNWIYKAKDQQPLKKKNPVYQEKPQFKLQEEIELVSKNNFRNQLHDTVLKSISFIKINL